MLRRLSQLARTAPAIAGLLLCAGPATAQLALDEVPDQARGIEVTERTGQQAELLVELRNTDNQTVKLADYFNQKASNGKPKPVVLTMVYYSCPIVCPVTLDKLTKLLAGVDYTVGEDYNVVVVSFNPDERTPDAAKAREMALASYGRTGPAVREGMAFHTATAVDARALANSIGFNYRRLPNGEFSHPVSTVILTPEGTISRYLHGLDDAGRPFDVKMALLEATSGGIGKSLGDRLLFTCFRYDPNAGAYSAEAMAIMKLGALLTVTALVLLIGTLRIRELAVGKARRNTSKNESGDDRPSNRPEKRNPSREPRVIPAQTG